MPWHGMATPSHLPHLSLLACTVVSWTSLSLSWSSSCTPLTKTEPDRARTRAPSGAQTRPCLARARMALTLDAPERDDAHCLASPRPFLSAPVDARRHPEAPGHGHLPAGTPCSTTTTPITRRGTAPSHQTRHRHRAPAAPRSRASASPGPQEPDAPMSCLFATLERRRRQRP